VGGHRETSKAPVFTRILMLLRTLTSWSELPRFIKAEPGHKQS
jgi:hypothetical protein